jgi:hypothetical protein
MATRTIGEIITEAANSEPTPLWDLPAEVIKEYLVESEHQSWEGFDESEQVVLEKLLTDIRLYVRVRAETEGM